MKYFKQNIPEKDRERQNKRKNEQKREFEERKKGKKKNTKSGKILTVLKKGVTIIFIKCDEKEKIRVK